MACLRKRSLALILSFILGYTALGGIVVACFFLPSFLLQVVDWSGDARLYRVVLTLIYIGMAIAAAAIICLLRLLCLVRRGIVFSSRSCSLVTTIAWLVIAEGGVFAVIGFVRVTAFAVTFVALTIGLCLLVVRGVLLEAASIKEENDGTI